MPTIPPEVYGPFGALVLLVIGIALAGRVIVVLNRKADAVNALYLSELIRQRDAALSVAGAANDARDQAVDAVDKLADLIVEGFEKVDAQLVEIAKALRRPR